MARGQGLRSTWKAAFDDSVISQRRNFSVICSAIRACTYVNISGQAGVPGTWVVINQRGLEKIFGIFRKGDKGWVYRGCATVFRGRGSRKVDGVSVRTG